MKSINYRISHNYIFYITLNPRHTDIQRIGTINLLLCSTLSKLPSHKKMRYPTITFRVYHNWYNLLQNAICTWHNTIITFWILTVSKRLSALYISTPRLKHKTISKPACTSTKNSTGFYDCKNNTYNSCYNVTYCALILHGNSFYIEKSPKT